MGATVFHSQSLLHFSTSTAAFSKTKLLGRPKFPRQDITDGPCPLLFASQKLLTTRADGNGRGISAQKASDLGRIPNDNGNKVRGLAGSKSSRNNEELIALLGRIRSSISGGSATASAKETSSKSSNDNAAVESLLNVLRQSRRQGRTARNEGKSNSNPRRDPSRKGLKAEFSSPLTRAPSKFVRRSPIPSPSSRRETVELKSITMETPQFPEIIDVSVNELKKMKLPQLKELAKSRGIRGFSRLKKAELVKLLST